MPEFFEGEAAKIGEVSFKPSPHVLIGVQLRSRRGQEFQVQALCPSVFKQRFDLFRTMNLGSVPNHRQLSFEVPQHVLQKTSYLFAVESPFDGPRQQLARLTYGADAAEPSIIQRSP